jgi:hypothetical protein
MTGCRSASPATRRRFYSHLARVLLLWPMSRVTAHFAALDRDDDGDDA